MAREADNQFDNSLLVKRLEEELPGRGILDAEDYIVIESSREFRFVAEVDPRDLSIHAAMTVRRSDEEDDAEAKIEAARARWKAAGFSPVKPGEWRTPIDPIVEEGEVAFVESMTRECAGVADLVRVVAWLEGDEA